MNLELLDAFMQRYPEEHDGLLDCYASYAITCQFNRAGSLLAVGCNDGRIVIWDFLTRGIAKFIMAHSHPVCSVTWSRDSKKLVSASTDNMVCMWDVVTGECERHFRFPCPVLRVQFHPRAHGGGRLVLVCPMKHTPVILDLESTSVTLMPTDEDGDQNVVASFDRSGNFIFTGNSRGRVTVYRSKDFSVLTAFKSTAASSNTAVKSIEFSRRGKCFLLNCADRVIRVYSCRDLLQNASRSPRDPEPQQKLKDLVTGSHWRKCCFSGDGEYVCAASVKQHSIYLWERAAGQLVKILHGTKGETLLDVCWHPLRPIITSISNGVVNIWSQAQVQNWSAFAPDFKELDENLEYEERESEFDLGDEDKKVEEVVKVVEETEEVDVVTPEAILALLSSDEEDEQTDILMYLPIAPEVEEPEEGGHVTSPDQSMDSPDKQGKNAAMDSPSKRKRPRTVDVDLPNAPTDESHPFSNTKRSAPSAASKKGGVNAGGGNSTTVTAQRKSARGHTRGDRSKARNKLNL